MAVKTYRKTALVTAEQFLPAIGQLPKGVFSTALGNPARRPDAEWALNTKEARHILRVGDYVCTGPAGEQWNVAKEIFESTYEEVVASPREKYLNLVDNKIYEMVSEDGGGITFKREGRDTPYYLGKEEFYRRFQLQTESQQPSQVSP